MWLDTKLIDVAHIPDDDDDTAADDGYLTAIAFTTGFTHNPQLVVYCIMKAKFYDDQTPAAVTKMPDCAPISPPNTWGGPATQPEEEQPKVDEWNFQYF